MSIEDCGHYTKLRRANVSLQLLEANQKFMEVRLEVHSIVLSQNFIAKAEAFYTNSNLKELKKCNHKIDQNKNGFEIIS